MNLRRRLNGEPIQLQLAPMIDVVMFLLRFFLLTWNLARYEQDLEVKVPVAKNGKEPARLPGEVIINLRQDGTVELERSSLTVDQLEAKLHRDPGGLPRPSRHFARRGGSPLQMGRPRPRRLPRRETDEHRLCHEPA